MSIAIIAFTPAGYALGKRLNAQLNTSSMESALYRCPTGALNDWTSEHFNSDDALLFIGASGIAVRAIAPYVKSKISDPAVVVIDELGRFAIPLLSGHIGGANRLARDIARMLGAIPIITTATDCNHVFSIDTWASENKIRILNPQRIKWISARLLAGESIYLKSIFPVGGKLPDGIIARDDEYDVILTIKTEGRKNALWLVPPVLTLGIGCKKGISSEEIEATFNMVLAKASCHKEAVCRVCSIDIKAQEAGLLSFCKAHDLPLQTFSAEQLNAVQGHFISSKFVQEITGVDNVCERSAVLGSGGELFVRKQVGNGVTIALAIAPYTVRFWEE